MGEVEQMSIQIQSTTRKLENKSLGSKAADIIREKIILGEYTQGLRLTEGEFAIGLGVSHSCVREAFGILEAEGLIKSIRNKCTEVVRFTGQDIEEIYSLRLAIEKLCAEVCIKKSCIKLEKLKEQSKKISLTAVDTLDDLMKSVEADITFHETIIYSSGNMRAIGVWHALRNQIKTLLYAINKKAYDMLIAVNTKDHDEIIKAFKQSDLKRIISLLTPHIEGGLNLCLKYNDND